VKLTSAIESLRMCGAFHALSVYAFMSRILITLTTLFLRTLYAFLRFKVNDLHEVSAREITVFPSALYVQLVSCLTFPIALRQKLNACVSLPLSLIYFTSHWCQKECFIFTFN
jgi:hypothetical protein